MLPAQNECDPDMQHQAGHIVPIVNQAVHLGTTITTNGNYHAEISARIAASMTTCKQLDVLWDKTPLSNKREFRVYGAAVTTQLLYGLESASLSNSDRNRLEAFQTKASAIFPKWKTEVSEIQMLQIIIDRQTIESLKFYKQIITILWTKLH